MSTRGEPGDDLDDDWRAHLAFEIDARIEQGATPADARTGALRALGSRGLAREAVRAVWVPRWLDEARQDLRFALRTLWRHRAFSLSAVLTLALAIGAVTVIGSLTQSVVWRRLPYPAADRLVTLWLRADGETVPRRLAFDTAEAWRLHAATLEGAGVMDGATATLNWTDGAERGSVMRAAPEALQLLALVPYRGRLFTAAEAAAGRRVAMISQRIWRDRFSASDQALGSMLVIDGEPREIVGVLPAAQPGHVLADADVLEPYSGAPGWRTRTPSHGSGPWTVLARLRPGVTSEAVSSELTAVARAAAANRDPLTSAQAIVVPLDEHLVGSRTRLILFTLMAAAGCMLAIALANIASLSLTRSIERLSEVGLRASLGATPARLVRQLVVESLTLTIVAGLAGAAIAMAAVRTTPRLVSDVARLGELQVGPAVLVWSAMLAVAAGVVLAVVPCLILTGRRTGHRSVATRATTTGTLVLRARRVVLVAELAIAVTLVGGAALLVRSWSSLTRVDPGFQSARVHMLQLSTTSYDTPARRAQFYAQVVERVSAEPDVEMAGLVSEVMSATDSDTVVTTDDASGFRRVRLRVRRDEATGGALRAIGASVRRGRMLSQEDHAGAPPAVLVNEQFVRQVWPDGVAVGRRLTFEEPATTARWFTVVGVVADMRREGLERPPVAQAFESVAQNPPRGGVLLVRTTARPQEDLAHRLEQDIRRIDPQVPIYGVTTLTEWLGASQAQRRLQTGIVAMLAVLALIIAAVGIYGLALHTVTARTREIGIRIALGADVAHVLRTSLGEGVRVCALGIALGLGGAVAAGRAARTLLFGVGVTDPLALGVTVTVLVTVTLGACYIPARRALRVSPTVALRES